MLNKVKSILKNIAMMYAVIFATAAIFYISQSLFFDAMPRELSSLDRAVYAGCIGLGVVGLVVAAVSIYRENRAKKGV